MAAGKGTDPKHPSTPPPDTPTSSSLPQTEPAPTVPPSPSPSTLSTTSLFSSASLLNPAPKKYRIATECVYVEPIGGIRDPYNSGSVPIYQTATFKQHSATEMGEYDYSRSGNPTRTHLGGLKLETMVPIGVGFLGYGWEQCGGNNIVEFGKCSPIGGSALLNDDAQSL
ncbi:cystathionine beta-lyase [Rhizophlyctis rosea]|nr:cystathionine beta-lyase [Rhizophlyctis rosea]